jgi:protocatechuate 3,4-dioxygenase beta subunit
VTRSRREILIGLGTAGAVLSVGCGGGDAATDSSPTDPMTGSSNTSGACVVAPQETEGPYPSLVDLVRSDIRAGRPGVPLSLVITVVNAAGGCAPVSAAAVDIWQCDAEGRYSEYTQPGYDGRAETFLRGRQLTDAAGRVTFLTVYPGWYAGRATHIHAEVSVSGRSVKVTQIAFPETVNAAVYRSTLYAARGLNPTANTRDMVFADSISNELAAITGDPAGGYTATFMIGVSV